MFRKVLIANRGEIARRLIRACHELGVAAVAVHSEADANTLWVREADEAYVLPGVAAAQTYLNQPLILDTARQAGAEAIHPGYGFLSENATFAAACREQGIVFIGPTPAAMYQMGSKARARETARQVGVPVTPGVDGAGLDSAELSAAAAQLGYPILIKASAGGGGKGMRVVWQAGEFADALQAARGEALSSFGDDHILLEKYFTALHHVEVQILGDHHGHIVHLFERECSVQRRHQKIIEETPAPCLSHALRARICDAARRLAQAVAYTSAGTIEFMVTGPDEFYLLEMNTRLQVEHPISEWVTGVDIAAWQIRIAAGEPLAFTQADLSQRGHALECRLYAEDPAMNFLPSIGQITAYTPPAGPGVRVDDGIEVGSHVTPYYDPMLAKIITCGQDRAEAIRKMARALRETVVLGVTTNLPYLLSILTEERFLRGDTPTSYLQEVFPVWQPDQSPDLALLLAVAAVETLRGSGASPSAAAAATEERPFDPWGLASAWRNS